MSLSNQYQTDEAKEKNGAELVIGVNDHNGKEIKFLVARRGGRNYAFSKAQEARSKPYRHQIQTETLPKSKEIELNALMFADACMKGWENVPLSDITGDPKDANELAPFNHGNVVKLLLNIPDLASTVYIQTSGADLYKLQREEDAKN